MLSFSLRPLLVAAFTFAAGSGAVWAQSANGDQDNGLPLEPERWARFTTDEGTWISLDVSSDGERIVFDLLGDLYTIPVTGGTATRITHGIAHDMQPRFSPDGTEVVFVSDRSGDENVWIVSLESGEVRPLTTGDDSGYLSPIWTPDGDYIVVSRSEGLGGAAKLHLYHARGGAGAQIIREPENLKTLGAAFGPDPRYIWFAQRTGSWRYNTPFPDYQLATYDRETGQRSVQSFRYGSAFRPTLSPDGRWLVFGTRHNADTALRIRDLDTGEERWLAYPVQRDDKESTAELDVLPGYAFTPDSRYVVMSYGGKIWRVPLNGAAPILVETTSLRLEPDTFIVSSQAPVSIVMGTQRLRSIGMRAYLMDDRLELESEVHGQILPNRGR
jgi:WD40 repeat protein